MREFQLKKLIRGNTNEDFCFLKLQLSLEIIGQEEEEGKACYKFELFGKLQLYWFYVAFQTYCMLWSFFFLFVEFGIYNI